MATGRCFERYLVVAVFILVYEYGSARPITDSLYGDHVYSGAIYPISGAVPKKIHNHERRKTTPAMESPTGKTSMNFVPGKTPPSMNFSTGKTPSMNSSAGKTPPSINSTTAKTTAAMDSSSDVTGPAMNSPSGKSYPEMTDSLYGDRVYSGAIYPISGAVPKKIHSQKRKRNNKSL